MNLEWLQSPAVMCSSLEEDQVSMCSPTAQGLARAERMGETSSSFDDSLRFDPEDWRSMERVARYMIRAPLSLERMRYSEGDTPRVMTR